MKIIKRILSGKFKGYTIRQSKNGWFDLYSSIGVSQLNKKNTMNDINNFIKYEH